MSQQFSSLSWLASPVIEPELSSVPPSSVRVLCLACGFPRSCFCHRAWRFSKAGRLSDFGACIHASFRSPYMLEHDCSSPTLMLEGQFTERKPSYSFSVLIALAIDRSPHQRLTVSEIYAWIEDNFPYFKSDSSNWKVWVVNLSAVPERLANRRLTERSSHSQ